LRDILEWIVEMGLKEGASFCEARYFEQRSNSISVENGVARALSFGILRGIGVRVIVNDRWGFASTNIVTKPSAKKVLKDAIGSAKAITAQTGEEARIVEVEPSVDTVIHDVKIKSEDVSPEEKTKRMLEIEEAARSFSNRVKDTFVAYRDIVTRVAVCNSFGTMVEEVTPRTYVRCRVIAKEGENMQEGYENIGNVAGYELVENIEIENFSLKAAKKAVSLLSARPPPRGTYTVVVDPKVGGLFIHEAFGHNSEGDLVFAGQSIISDKIGRKIASNLVTIIDDPTKIGFGHFKYDHEGTEAKPHLLVKDGVLMGFLHSLESAAKVGGKPEGSARAASHHYPPIVRMSNTYLAPRDMSLEEILEDIDYGLYLAGSQYGYVECQKGQFTCKVEEAWLIERGELTEHLRDVAISGLTLEALKNISAVGRDFKMNMPGRCGKSGQGMYVDAGAPHFRIDGVVVGGRR